jgi:hypothetical protein
MAITFDRRFGLIVVFLLAFAYLTFQQSMSLSEQQLHNFSQDFKSLRNKKGHWEGGEYNDDVDQFGGRKHTAMQALGEYLGQPGTPINKILELMGEPDEVKTADGRTNFMVFVS